jgi:hypothetical protein
LTQLSPGARARVERAMVASRAALEQRVVRPYAAGLVSRAGLPSAEVAQRLLAELTPLASSAGTRG